MIASGVALFLLCVRLWHFFRLSLGLPTFTQQPEDINTTRDTPFTLSCAAEGPPEPVSIRWLRDGLPVSEFQKSPSNFSVSGEIKATPSSLLHLSLSLSLTFGGQPHDSSFSACSC